MAWVGLAIGRAGLESCVLIDDWAWGAAHHRTYERRPIPNGGGMSVSVQNGPSP